jgi:hypothetical protein
MNPRHRTPLAAACAALLASLPVPAHAAPMDVILGFTSLPSAQGFSYVATGAHAGVAEGSVFAVGGGLLDQNTIGQYAGTSGAGLFYQRSGGITTTEVKQLSARVRCLQVQGSTVYPLGQGGLFFGFATGSVQYGFTLTPTRIGLLQGSGYTMLAPTYDNTQFHDYVFEYLSATDLRLYRDGVLIGTTTTGGALVANRILFGDATGGANAHAEIAAFRFVQDLATPTAGTSWGRIKSLYR